MTIEYRTADGDAFRVMAPSDTSPGRTAVDLRISLVEENDRAAARLRESFRRRGLVAVNLVSSPGAGKTALLERTLDEFGRQCPCAVVVGDLETDNDARRLRRGPAPVAQITTGSTCHLDATMVERGAASLDLAGVRLLFIENVGNLVCPAAFDLGESCRVVLLSTPEGEDKPLKYPPLFQTASVVVVTKMDLASVLGWNRDAALRNIREVAPQVPVISLSARLGVGLDAWYRLLQSLLAGAPP